MNMITALMFALIRQNRRKLGQRSRISLLIRHQRLTRSAHKCFRALWKIQSGRIGYYPPMSQILQTALFLTNALRFASLMTRVIISKGASIPLLRRQTAHPLTVMIALSPQASVSTIPIRASAGCLHQNSMLKGSGKLIRLSLYYFDCDLKYFFLLRWWQWF